jgi:hypothetical protein
MSNTFELDSQRDKLDKASRERTRLIEALRSQDRSRIADAIFNFAVSAFHVKDWLKECPSGSYAAADVEGYVFGDQQLRLCREICHASKHFSLRPPPVEVAEVTTSATSIISTYLPDREAVRLETQDTPHFRVKIVAFDGSRFEANEFASHVIGVWERFFAKHGVDQ